MKLISIYIFLEYFRPQDILPFLRVLHLPMLTILLIIYSLFTKKVTFSNKVTKTFIFLIVLLILHVPLATNNFWAYQTARTMTIIFIVYLGIITLLKTKTDLLKIFQLWTIIGVFCAVKGYTEGGRIPNSAFLGDENDFATYVIMMVPFAYFSIFFAQKAWQRIISIFFVIVLILGGISSLSRGGFIAICVVGLFCWLYSSKKLISSVVILSFIGIFFLSVPDSYIAEVKSITEAKTYQSGTGGQRFHLWGAAWRMFLDNPLIGVGGGNFPWRVIEYEGKRFRDRTHGGKQAHSTYFTLLPELGLLGVVLFSGLLIQPTLESRKMNRIIKSKMKQFKKDGIKCDQDEVIYSNLKEMFLLQRGIWGALVAFLVNGAFLSMLYYPHLWILIGLMVSYNQITKNILIEFKLIPANDM